MSANKILQIDTKELGRNNKKGTWNDNWNVKGFQTKGMQDFRISVCQSAEIRVE